MDRKQLIKTLAEHFGTTPKYLGAPSFAYQVQAKDQELIIDKEGRIKNKEGKELEIENLLKGEEEQTPLEIQLPMEEHTGNTLRNLVNMIYSKQVLIKKALELEEDIVVKEFIEKINEVKLETLEVFKDKYEEIGTNKIPGIAFDFEERIITFRFLTNIDSTKEILEFISVLNKTAMKLKQTSGKQTETDNEKFTFRTWLVRLGLVGLEYKETRKFLLKNLDGNGAFRKQAGGEE
ncbi:hypothetical protein EDC18_10570 [Natranaerovirga pectinivora]|uniref:Virulence-related protein n=1 Tax=Natranaerovirga pectinivora TaxID=682400 RepID=A0A4R3MJK6_9FIRM|nr:virulence-related protein [Natranaerovirga pectinivora]TCT14589.1 hypothetical protein EDC18_10570 [Natranaerovirga pectinivora]